MSDSPINRKWSAQICCQFVLDNSSIYGRIRVQWLQVRRPVREHSLTLTWRYGQLLGLPLYGRHASLLHSQDDGGCGTSHCAIGASQTPDPVGYRSYAVLSNVDPELDVRVLKGNVAVVCMYNCRLNRSICE